MEEWEKKMKRNDKCIDNKIGYEGVKTISESLKINTSLTTLNLGCDEKIWNEKEKKWNEAWVGNQIRDKGAKTISESLKINTSLTSLDLECDEKRINENEKRKWKEKLNE